MDKTTFKAKQYFWQHVVDHQYAQELNWQIVRVLFGAIFPMVCKVRFI